MTFLTVGPDAVGLTEKKIVAKGFERPEEIEMLAMRSFTMGSASSLFLTFGVLWFIIRNRRSKRKA